MRPWLTEWFVVVDRRGQRSWAIGLLIALAVALLEMVGAMVVAVALGLATSNGDPVAIPVLGDVTELLPGRNREADLAWMAAIGGAVFLLRGASMLLQQYAIFRSTFSLSVRLTDRVTDRLLSRPYAWHLSQNSSGLSAIALSVTHSFATRVFTPVQQVVSQGLIVIPLAIFAIAVEPMGALITVACLASVVVITLRITRRHLVRLGQVELEELGRGQQLTTEAFLAIREVKLLGLRRSLRTAVWRSRMRWAKAARQSASVVAAPRPIIESAAFIALIVLLGTSGQAGSGAAVSGLGVLGYAVVRILPTANNIITHINTARSAQASMHQLATVLSDESHPSEADDIPSERLSPPVRARDIRFEYSSGAEVLRGVSLDIEAGSSVGLVGMTGCGKSTLLDLLTGLLVPTSGSIEVGSKDLRDVRPSWWGSIGIVPQNITVLDTTLAENIALGQEASEIDPDALSRSMSLAQLDEVVRLLPEGVNSRIGERGLRLSGGQRQRLAIARALYRDPAVIFLDEGTSALDGVTEQAVIQSLRKDRPERTLIMVAHRISTLRDCNEILVLEQGKIVDRGKHDDLLKRSLLFRRLANAGASEE